MLVLLDMLVLLLGFGCLITATTVPLGPTTILQHPSLDHPLIVRLLERTGWSVQRGDTMQVNQIHVPIPLSHFHRHLAISHSRQEVSWSHYDHQHQFQQPPTPRWDVRGNQISIAHHPSFFRTSAELRTFVIDLTIFGNNMIETAHVVDAKDLPIATLVNISNLLFDLNTSCSFWWSNKLMDAHLHELPELFSRMKRIDSIFFPGGDGGECVKMKQSLLLLLLLAGWLNWFSFVKLTHLSRVLLFLLSSSSFFSMQVNLNGRLFSRRHVRHEHTIQMLAFGSQRKR